ncbi:hypothetical protein [Tenacibaculum xiamenense]|uniref:hypothetical protein n=1 Tax=Tenacibaculum xiamenense TaxID=1261553 RepID=UPI0038B68348
MSGIGSIQRIGRMNLEQEQAEVSKACSNMEDNLASDRAEHRNELEKLHKNKYKLFYLLKRRTKEDLRNVSQDEEFIPTVEFENTDDSDIELSKDAVEITFNHIVPKRDCPKEIKLVNELLKDVHHLAIQKASIVSEQYKRGAIKPLLKIKAAIQKAKEPLVQNIIGYASPFLAVFSKICLLFNYASEGVILQNIFHHNLGYSTEESWIVASTLLGITFVISRRIFNSSERLLRSVKKQWWIITLMSCVFFGQITASSVLSNYNIQHERQMEVLRSDRMALALKQGELTELDEDEDVEEIEELNIVITNLSEDIQRRSYALKITPIWSTYTGYIVVGLVSILCLFFTIILKAISEVYSYAAKLKKAIKKSERRIAEIEELYPEKVKDLLTCYDMRHKITYYIAKKNILELLLSQEDDMNTNSFFEAYKIQQ